MYLSYMHAVAYGTHPWLLVLALAVLEDMELHHYHHCNYPRMITFTTDLYIYKYKEKFVILQAIGII